jgi:malonyl-CoA decarboxylase
LLSRRGEASGMALAQEIFSRWDLMNEDERIAFLATMVDRFPPDQAVLEPAITAAQAPPTPANLSALHLASEAKRQEIIRRLNHAPDGTRRLVRMRETLLAARKTNPALDVLDSDFFHLFASWFNRGFLHLKRIDWTIPANILEKIIRYEAVHEINDWDELRRRIEPPDRRLFAFFHPQMPDEPLIFVEVALTDRVPAHILPMLAADRPIIGPTDAKVAVFYSISNCQNGLAGISFGNFLIKQVVEDLRSELLGLRTFVTLSPIPGFAGWLSKQRGLEDSTTALSRDERQLLSLLDEQGWALDGKVAARLTPVLEALAARYLVTAKDKRGRPLDPVARFHLGNGARLEQLNMLGDPTPKGLAQSHGMMVNYLYDIGQIEKNHEAYAESGRIAASGAVRKKVRPV